MAVPNQKPVFSKLNKCREAKGFAPLPKQVRQTSRDVSAIAGFAST